MTSNGSRITSLKFTMPLTDAAAQCLANCIGAPVEYTLPDGSQGTAQPWR